MSELIDRQAAIDAIRASASKYTGFMGMEMYTDDDAVEAIEAVPAASPWHRVEDGLPDKYTQCLVVDADGKCAVGYYRYDCEAWDSPAFGWIEAEDRKYIDYMPMGIGKVVAWMPIEPPKEDA